MNPPTAPHARPRARALALGLGVLIAVAAAATARTRNVYELCGSCGALRITREVLGVPVRTRVESKGWLGSLVEAEHRHGFVAYFRTQGGWLGWGIACRMPPERSWILRLESAHEALGDDPVLVALGTRYVRTEPEARYQRIVLAEAARALAER